MKHCFLYKERFQTHFQSSSMQMKSRMTDKAVYIAVFTYNVIITVTKPHST